MTEGVTPKKARQRRAELRAQERRRVRLVDLCNKRRKHRVAEGGTICLDCGTILR